MSSICLFSIPKPSISVLHKDCEWRIRTRFRDPKFTSRNHIKFGSCRRHTYIRALKNDAVSGQNDAHTVTHHDEEEDAVHDSGKEVVQEKAYVVGDSTKGETDALFRIEDLRKLAPTFRSGSDIQKWLSQTSKRAIFIETHLLRFRFLKIIYIIDEVVEKQEICHSEIEYATSFFEMLSGLGAGESYASVLHQAMMRFDSWTRDLYESLTLANKKRILKRMPRISSDLSELILYGQGSKQNKTGFKRYLKASEKHTLSSQTGLSKSQVAKWFINARVSLWRPMIEEMYQEECAAESNSGKGCADSAEDPCKKE